MISFKMNFNKEEFKRNLTEATFKAAQEGIQRKVAGVRCPTHGESARAEFINKTGNQLEYKIHACCELKPCSLIRNRTTQPGKAASSLGSN